MNSIDLAHLRQWIGQTISDTDIANVRQARSRDEGLLRQSQGRAHEARMPPLWRWLHHLKGRPPGELGRDDHPARGGFLPPVPLANRM